MRRALGWIGAFVATRALGFALHGWLPEDRYDLGLLWHSAQAAATDAVPYRDFVFEYPPGALSLVRALHAFSGGTLDGFCLAFRVLALAADASLLAAVLALAPPGRRLVAGLAALLVPLALFPISWARLDPIMLAPLALALLLSRREQPELSAAASGALIAAAGAVKISPWIALPALLLALPLRRALLALAGFTAALALIALPSLLESGAAALSFLTYHKERGLQVESTPAVVAALAAKLTGAPLAIARAARSWQLSGPTADALTPLATPFLALALLATLVHLARLRARETPLDPARAAVALLLVFLVAANVLSPQFVLLVPLAAAALPTRATAAAAIAAAVLTTAIYPVAYAAVLSAAPWALALIALRNGLLALLALLLLRRPT